MRQLDKIIFLLILVKVNVLQSKPIVTCSCTKDIPLVLKVPVAPPPLEVPCPTHGYKIEVPPPPALPAAKLTSLDLVVEAPVPCAPPPVCNPLAAPAPLPAAVPAPCGCAAPVPPPAPAPCGCAVPVPPPAPLPVALPPPALAPCGCALPALPPAPLPVAVPPPALAPCGCALPAPPPAPLPVAVPPPALAPCGCALPAPPPAPLPVALPPPALAPCGCALPAPPPVPPCAPPALPAIVDDFSGVAALKAPLPPAVTYELIASALPAAPLAPLPGAYSLPLSDLTYACEKAPLPEPPCRYVSKDISSNIIYRERSKREVSSHKQKYMDEILDYVKSLKTTRVARKAKKSKLVKRDIKGEYDLLQREQSQMDLTIPEIIQYMPETMMPSFKRGKCNIGCKNCIRDSNEKFKKQLNSALPTENTDKENEQPTEQEQQQQPQKALNDNPTESPNQHFDMSPQSAGENYFKRSVIPLQNQNPNPGYSGLLPPPYISSTMELTKLAQNPGNPIWYQPQSLTDTNVEYVYDRLGHKYKVKNGSFKLVTPSEQNDDEVNSQSTQVASAENTEETTTARTTTTDKVEVLDSSVQNASDQQMIDEEARKMFDSALQKHEFIDVSAPSVDIVNSETMIQPPTPTVGAPSAHQQKPTSDPHMDKIIRDIVYQHPDFIDATQHAPGSLTLPEEVTRDETMHFLDKLIRGRLSKWFGEPSEEVPMHRLQDLNRYSRETGTSIKFIPVVTVDKGRLDKFRQTNVEDTT